MARSEAAPTLMVVSTDGIGLVLGIKSRAEKTSKFSKILGGQKRKSKIHIVGHKAKIIREITGSHDNAASAVMISNDDFHIATNTIQSRIVQLRLCF